MSIPPLSHGTGFHLGWTNRTPKAVRPEEFYGADVLPEANSPLPCCCHHVLYAWGDSTRALGICRMPVQSTEESFRASPSQRGTVLPDAAISQNIMQNPWPRYWPSTENRGLFGAPLQNADEVKSVRVTPEEFEQITGTPPTQQQLESQDELLRINPAMHFTHVSFGRDYAIAIDQNGELWGWGASSADPASVSTGASGVQYSVFGVPYNRSQFIDTNVFLSPRLLARGEYVVSTNPTWANLRFLDCAAGNGHALFIDEHERLWVTGLNNKGQLGDGTTQSTQFAKILGDKKWKSVAAADNYSVAIDEDGDLYFWGEEIIRGLSVLSPRRVFGWLENLTISSGGTYSPSSATSLQPISAQYTVAAPAGSDAVAARARGLRYSGSVSPPSPFTTTGAIEVASLAFVDPGNGYTSTPASFTVDFVLGGSQSVAPSFGVSVRADDIVWKQVKACPQQTNSTRVGASGDRGGIAALDEEGRLWFWSPSAVRIVPSIPGIFTQAMNVINEIQSGGEYLTAQATWLIAQWSLANPGRADVATRPHPLDDASGSLVGTRFCSPVQIASGVIDFSIGATHFLIRTANGDLSAAGSNTRGQCSVPDDRTALPTSVVYSYANREYLTEWAKMEGVVGPVVANEDLRYGQSFAAGEEVSAAVVLVNQTGQDYLSQAREVIEGDEYFGDETITPERAIVACGKAGSICGAWGVASMLRSTNGTTWTRHATIGGYAFSTCVYGNGVFFACSETGNAMVSSDGATWTRVDSAPAITSVAFGLGRFVGTARNATNNQNILYSSTDGLVWSRITGVPTQADEDTVVFGNGIFSAGSSSGVGNLYSTDGVTWLTRANTISGTLVFAGSYFFILGRGGGIYRSSDSLTWQELTLPDEARRPYSAIAYGGGRYVAVSASLSHALALGAADTPQRRFGDKRTVLVSTDATTWVSNDGVEATAVNYRPYVVRSIIHDGTRFLCAGTSGGLSLAFGDNIDDIWRVLSSTDGVTWTLVPSESVARCGLLAHGGGVTVALPMVADVMEMQAIWSYGQVSNQDFNWQSVFLGSNTSVQSPDGVAVACRIPLSSDDKPWQA